MLHLRIIYLNLYLNNVYLGSCIVTVTTSIKAGTDKKSSKISVFIYGSLRIKELSMYIPYSFGLSLIFVCFEVSELCG